MSTTAPRPDLITDPTGVRPSAAGPGPGRGWAVVGSLTGLIGLVGLFATALGGDTSVLADNADLVASMSHLGPVVWALQTLTFLVAAGLMVFGAGLHRRLAAQEPATSLVPAVAAAGVYLTSAVVLVGGGISTELFHHLRNHELVDPDTIAALSSIYNTLPWVWAGVGVSAAAVALGGLRHGSVGKLFAVFSLGCAAVVLLTQVTPFQYLALVPAAIWVTVAGIVFARRARS